MNIKNIFFIILCGVNCLFGAVGPSRPDRVLSEREREFLKTYTGEATVCAPEQKRLINELLRKGTFEKKMACADVLHHDDGIINAMAMNQDGTLLASSSSLNTIGLWNVRNGTNVYKVHRAHGIVSELIFSPDGQLLAGILDGRSICLWNATNGTLIRELPIQEVDCPVRFLQFSPDGKGLAVGSAHGIIYIWSVRNSFALNRVQASVSSISAMVFSPDSCSLIFANQTGTIRLWNVVAHTVKDLVTAGCASNSLVFNRAGTLLAASFSDNTIKLIRVSDSRVERIFHSRAPVKYLMFNLSENALVGCLRNNEICLWDAFGGDVCQTIEHESEIASAAMYSDGSLLAIGSIDGSIYLWQKLSVSQQLLMLKALHEPLLVNAQQRETLQKVLLTMPSDSQRLVIQHMPLLAKEYDGSVWLQHLPDVPCTLVIGERSLVLTASDQQRILSRAILASQNSSFFKTESCVRIPFAVDARTYDDFVKMVTSHELCIPKTADFFRVFDYLQCQNDFSDTSVKTAIFDIRKQIHVPTLGIEHPQQIYQGHIDRPIDFYIHTSPPDMLRYEYSPDGVYLLGVTNEDIIVWNAHKRSVVTARNFLDFTTDFNTAIAWSCDSKHYAVCSEKQCYIAETEFNPEHGATVNFEFVEPVTQLLYLNNDRLLGFSPYSQHLYVYNVSATPAPVLEASVSIDGTEAWCIALSPDKRTLAVGSGRGEVELVDITTTALLPVAGADGQPLPVLLHDDDSVVAVAFMNDGRHLATAVEDGTIRIWDIAQARQILVLRGYGRPLFSTRSWLSFNHDNSTVTLSSHNASGAPVMRTWFISKGTSAFYAEGRNAISSPDGIWEAEVVGDVFCQRLITPPLTEPQHLLVDKALECPTPLSAGMLAPEQAAQIDPATMTTYVDDQKKYLLEVFATLPVHVQKLVSYLMPWLSEGK